MDIKKNKHTISIIVPALNEERVLENYITPAIQIISDTFDNYEVILINDGSSDSTGHIMNSVANKFSNVSVIHNLKNIGLGNCYQLGISKASKEYVMMLCGDGGVPTRSLPPIFHSIGEADIVIPWMQNLKEIKSVNRYLLSRSYTNILNFIFGLNLHYYNGLPVLKVPDIRSISVTSGGFGVQAEILIKLIKSGKTYVQIPAWGAEEKGSSFALRPRNWISVSKTIVKLFIEFNLSRK